MGNFENPGAVLIVGSVLLSTVTGIGLILGALSIAAVRGWRPAMATREDKRWPIGLKLLVAGTTLLALGLFETALIVTYYFVVVAE